MTVFEYVMVLTSILIGLGIAELLNGVVRILRSDFKQSIFVPQIAWAIYLFIYILVIWWSRWDLRDSIEWNFIQLLLSLTSPILIFVLAGLIFPHQQSGKEYFYNRRKPFYTLLWISTVVSLFHEIFIEGTVLISFISIAILIQIVVITWARFSIRDHVHTIAAILNILLISIAILFSTYALKS